MKKRLSWLFLGLANSLVLGIPSGISAAPSAATMLLLSTGAVLFGLLKK
ncbi:MAG TPA: hypothetical protein PK054_07280 [Anaerohalosphaeraceae bacterium]|nr:hypothetical protein [Anaerohalosphaeraceae bacterium]HOL89179.1 hypothetical protein [Anaerohalosphaeraceae bacterium]HPP56370.1 hypothetical protein [Anaerohalosphaeraceae bacterium]